MNNVILKYNKKCTSSFTGKERDSETGFSYFGARFYDSDILTGWLSVDPMADKYPGLSPYAYCANNPVKLVDPDGRDVWLPGGDLYSPNMKTEGYDHDDAVTIQALNEIYKELIAIAGNIMKLYTDIENYRAAVGNGLAAYIKPTSSSTNNQ
jgi:RHS repeat-associated protein